MTWHTKKSLPDCYGEWCLSEKAAKLDWPAPPVDDVVRLIRNFQAVGGAVTFNLLCWQEDIIYDSDLEVMRQVKSRIRGR